MRQEPSLRRTGVPGMSLPLKYRFPDGYDIGRLIRELADRYRVRAERSRSETISFYDTFDWRLYRRSLVLCTAGSRLFLRKLFEDAPIHHAEVTVPPVFLRDIPDGGLKKKLAPIVDVRALRKLAELYSRSTPYRIVNHEGKTVARILHEEIRIFAGHGRPVAGGNPLVGTGERK